MRNKFRHRAVAMLLAAMMTAAPVSGTVFAADELAADQGQPIAAAEVKEEIKEEAKTEIKEEVKEEKESLAQEAEKAAEEKKAEAPAEAKVVEEAKPVETRKQASSYKVTVSLEGIKLTDGSESTETLSYTVYTNGSKTISASILSGKVKTKSFKIDGVTYKFESLWEDASGNKVSSIYINGADLWDPTELVYRAVYSATPDKTVTVNFVNIYKADGTTVSDSISTTLSAGSGWSFTKKKLDNKVLATKFDINGDEYEYAGKWEDENGNEFTSLSIKNADLEGDTVINVHPVYNVTECKKLSFVYSDGVSTGSGSWANKDNFSGFTHTFKQPENQLHYSFINWENTATGETYLKGDKFTVNSADLPEVRNEINIVANWQPSVTVRYHYNGITADTESFEGISVYDKSAEIDGVEYNAWYDADGNILADDAAFDAPAPVTEKTERTIYDVYARRPVTVTAASEEWTFDGQEHGNDKVSVTAGGLFEGDEIAAEVSGKITNVGEAENVIESVKIMRDGKDVSEYYDITAVNGALSIKAAPVPAATTDNSTPAAPQNRPSGRTAAAPQAAATAEIANTPVPQAAPEAVIADSAAPLAANGAWALLNLIMTVITGIISAVLLTGYFGKKEDEEDESDDAETKRKGLVRLASIIPAAGAIIAFILTEDMRLQMALTDRWTILMAVILLIQAVTAMFAKKEKEENEDTAEAIN